MTHHSPCNTPSPLSQSVIFTACSANYLIKASAMVMSALEHHPDVDMVILVVDGKRPVHIKEKRIRLLWGEDLGLPDYLQSAFKYNIIEFNTSLKPFATLRLLETYEQVIYLDPDVCVFSTLDSVYAALDIYDAVFTPHALSPYVGIGRPNDRDLLRFGSCNLGFFAVRRSETAKEMLTWWHERCQLECFYEPQIGLGVDQKWIDLAFTFFEGMGLLRDIGLNVAFWNLHERRLSQSDSKWYVNQKSVLGFIHFSSFVDSDEGAVADKQTRYDLNSRPDFSRAADVYRGYLERSKKLVDVSDLRYSYGQFDNGTSVSPTLRRFFAICDRPEVYAASNPFSSDDAVYKFAQEHNLVSRRPAKTIHTTFKAQVNYTVHQKIITMAFRIVLRLLGPDRYFNLMRYLAHYSSLLNQTDLLRKRKKSEKSQ